MLQHHCAKPEVDYCSRKEDRFPLTLRRHICGMRINLTDCRLRLENREVAEFLNLTVTP
jgi:hypothetical protein